MKKYLILTLVLAVVLSGCSKKVEEKNVIKTNTESDVRMLGNTNDSFKRINWARFEDREKVPKFEEMEIKDFEAENTIVDAYSAKEKNFIAVETSNGEINYNVLEDNKIKTISREEALDETVITKLDDGDEFWGFERQGEYIAVIKSSGTDIYKGDIKLFTLDGVASISDIDNNGIMEVAARNSEGNGLSVYSLNNERLDEVWNYTIDYETYHGDIQIGDINQDGVKEIYLDDIDGRIQKFILTKDGFSQDRRIPTIKEGYENSSIFIIDINRDGKSDVIAQRNGKKPVIYIQK